MSSLRVFFGFCVVLASFARVPAQDAQAIVDAAARVYAGAISYSADVDSRTVYFKFPQLADGKHGEPRVTSIQYRRLQIKVRRPYDYLLGTQIYSEGPTGELRTGGSSGGVSWSYLSRTENTHPKQGLTIGSRYSVVDIPAEQFSVLLNSRLGLRAREEVVLKYFQSLATENTDKPTLGLREVDVIGRESSKGRDLYRLVAKTKEGGAIMLWIDKDNSQIVRTIVQRTRSMQGANGKPMEAPEGEKASWVTAVDTFYNNQKINPALSQADFAISDTARASDRLSAADLGFPSTADLVKLAQIAPVTTTSGGEATSEGETEAEAMGETAPGPKAAGAETAPAAAQGGAGQALTYEQMSGLVLIDGDGGTATGFMTKIRDVDFVVTNLHVLVGNAKYTIKTLSGEEIAPLGIYGAVGGDIAIIRIGKGQGSLKLAQDVFKTNKIGDKVVVVGNRRGGGVATQTEGVIKGVGPRLVEVNANFEPGNSGSPIVNMETREVIGVATFASTRRIAVEDGSSRGSGATAAADTGEVDKRWFGFRLDSVSKWEAIDLAKWNAQAERLKKFKENSEALHAVIRLDFKTARQNSRLTTLIDNFETRYRAASSNPIIAAGEIKDLFRVIRTVSEDGVRDLTTGDYYDYYRTCQYWENSIPGQLEYRKAIIDVLKRYENNSSLYLSRMRNGAN